MSITDSINSTAAKYSPFELRRAWLSIDENAKAQEFVAGFFGKVAIHVAFALILAVSQQLSVASMTLISLTLLGIAVLPHYRLPIIVGSSMFYLFVRPFRIDGWSNLTKQQAEFLPAALPSITLQIMGVLLFLAAAVFFLRWISANPGARTAKRPVVTLMLAWTALFFAAYSLPQGNALSAVLWSAVGVSISGFWYLAYAATDQKNKEPTPPLLRAGFMRAFWGGSATPIGKSFGYLNKFDAKTENDLAITRLKGLKLAVWALLLTATVQVLDLIFYQWLSVPVLQTAIVNFANGEALSTGWNWAGLIANYFMDLLVIAVWGHFIVAAVRMAGFRIPRNTRNPLASRTLAEFWNRYFFYFKELLVDFFFYPAFVRYFKKNTKMRIAFATFCAAALGNFLYHFTRETYVFANLSFSEGLPIFQSAVFYSLALATGLIISQWRGRKLTPELGFIRYEVLPRVNVFAFFCFLKIFDDVTGIGTLTERAGFTLSLFGL